MVRRVEGHTLKPCPFCGYHAALCFRQRADTAPRVYFGQCESTTCDIEGPASDTEEGAIEYWNQRPGEAELETALRKLSEKLYGYYDPAFVPRLRESNAALLVAWGDARTLLNKRGGQ